MGRLSQIDEIVRGTFTGVDPAEFTTEEPEVTDVAPTQATGSGQFVNWAVQQAGDAYVWGAGRGGEDDPASFDCSGLVLASAKKLGIQVGGTAYDQWVQTKNSGGTLSVEEALRTPGALLFSGDGTGSGRGAITHVAISLGDGRTIEARGRRYGVVVVDAATNAKRFRFGGVIPGLSGGGTPTVDGKDKSTMAARLAAISDLIGGKSPRNVTARWGGIKQAAPFAGVATKAAGGGELDRFMGAVSGQESGGDYSAVNASSGAAGKYQVMPSNWGPWAEEAGLGRGAPRTPENQEIVVRHKMAQYYAQFGDWGAVAVSWYAGPSAAAAWLKNPQADRFNRRQGGGKYPSVNEYVRQVLGRMSGN